MIADSEKTHKDFLTVKIELQSLLGKDLDADEVVQCLIRAYRVVGKAQLKELLKGVA